MKHFDVYEFLKEKKFAFPPPPLKKGTENFF